MKILFLSRLYLPHVGGVEKHIYEICRLLATQHQITIIAEQDDLSEPLHEVTKTAEIFRIPVIGVSEKQKKWVIWKWLIKNYRVFTDVDIIHVHDVFFWFLPFRFIYLFKKVFITFHGYEGDHPPRLKSILSHKISAFLSDGNICIGDYHKKWYGVEPTYVSYGAVSSVKSTHKKTPERAAIFIGRLSEDNGIMDYLQAAKTLHISVDVFGDGSQRSLAENYVKTHRLPVKFYGFVPDAAKLMVNYKYAFISRYLGILEALLAGLPVISHYNNQIKYDYLSLAPFSNFISISSNHEEIVASVKKIEDNYPTKIITQGQTWARQQTWSKLVNLYLTLWTAKK